LIASVAAFNAWNEQGDDRRRRKFSERNFLNHQILTEVSSLRDHFRNCLGKLTIQLLSLGLRFQQVATKRLSLQISV
jgi:hypothetical protein